jgi:hypothetical protein
MGATASNTDCPSTFNKYLNVNKSDSDQQVWTALAPALYICGQERGEDTGNTGTSHPTLSLRRSNGVISATRCSKSK